MTATPFDLAFVAALIIVAYLLEQRVLWPRAHRRIAVGGPDPRLPVYRAIVVGEWVASLLVAAVWALERHPWAAIVGRPPTGWRLVLAAVLVVAPAVLFALQIRTVRAKMRSVAMTPERRAALRSRLGAVDVVAPHSVREFRAFQAVSVTAGVCEEWIFRGALTAVCAAWWGLPVAVVLVNVAFGIGHAYQGRAGILKTGVVGLVMSGIVLATGSLVPAMLVHAIMDLGGGATAYALMEEPVESLPVSGPVTA